MYSEWQLCPKCGGNGMIPNNFLDTTTTPFIQCDVCFGAKVLAKNVSENIAAYVHEIDSLRETNRKLGDLITELREEIKNDAVGILEDLYNALDSIPTYSKIGTVAEHCDMEAAKDIIDKFKASQLKQKQ